MKFAPGISMSAMMIVDHEKYLLNPGSVGQPRDGDNRAGVAVYTPEMGEVFYFRVPYDLPGAQMRIRLAGLPDVLAASLQHGR